MANTGAQAIDVGIPVESQSWYYEIGGAEPVSAPLNPYARTNTLGAGASLSVGYSCGNFDVTTSVSNLFSNVASSLEAQVMDAARGAIAALPLYVFQRALPGLYELFQNYSADFKVQFGDALKTCEEYEQVILAGEDPFDGWKQLAKGANWRNQMARDADLISAKQTVESQSGDRGVPWIGGVQAGGSGGQPPIEPIRDVTQAGWNTTLNRSPTNTSPYAGTPVRLVELFPTPAAAGRYAVEVLGDARIRTCNGCARETVSGHGLLPKYEAAREAIAKDLAALIAGTGVPTFAELQAVSSQSVGVSAAVIETLRRLSADERSIMAGRLASEVAVARTVEEALALRRLLLGGKRVPEVASATQATEAIDQGIEELEREIDTFLYEQRIRKEIAANTAGALIGRRNQLQGQGAGVGRLPRPEGVHLDEGGRFQ